MYCFFFFFNDTATTEIYTLSLHDALPTFQHLQPGLRGDHPSAAMVRNESIAGPVEPAGLRNRVPRHRAQLARSEEHTSELQSRQYLVCRLLLEKKKIYKILIIRPSLFHHK